MVSARSIWFHVCYGGSTAAILLYGGAAGAQPLPLDPDHSALLQDLAPQATRVEASPSSPEIQPPPVQEPPPLVALSNQGLDLSPDTTEQDRLQRLLADGQAAYEQTQALESAPIPVLETNLTELDDAAAVAEITFKKPDPILVSDLGQDLQVNPQRLDTADESLLVASENQSESLSSGNTSPIAQPPPLTPEALDQQRLDQLLQDGAAAIAQTDNLDSIQDSDSPAIETTSSVMLASELNVGSSQATEPLSSEILASDLDLVNSTEPAPEPISNSSLTPEPSDLGSDPIESGGQTVTADSLKSETGSTEAATLLNGSAPIESDSVLELIAPAILATQDQQLQPQLDPVRTYSDQAVSNSLLSQSVPGLLSPDYAPSLLQQFPLLQPGSEAAVESPSTADQPPIQTDDGVLESGLKEETTRPYIPPETAAFDGLAPQLLEKFPLFNPTVTQFASEEPVVAENPYDIRLLEKFPVLLQPSGSLADDPIATTPDIAPTPETTISRARQELSVTAQRELPLDPDQLNVTGDNLSYDADRNIGVAEGNAVIKLSDGTSISGDRLLYYQREKRLRSEGPFLLVQPRGRSNNGERQIRGQNLDFDIRTRSAQFESSLVILPGEEEGTRIFVRSDETTALVGDQIFFENATATTSPEPPITHYVKGDRIEVFPDDRLFVYDARVFGGGRQDDQGDLYGGTQLAYFPVFVFSLKDHQWVLPGQSDVEGIYVKSSWAYQFNKYNFGGIRVDAIEKKGIGLGIVHDYILPITDSENYGRAQFYLVTEADENRMSSRFRVDHSFNFYAANILGNYGEFQGDLNINLDNTYRPEGGRNDNSDVRFNGSFRADLSTTSLRIERTGSPTRGSYSFPISVTHQQRYGDVKWLQSDLNLRYTQRLSARDERDFSDTSFDIGVSATPPGALGNYRVRYRAKSSSNGDTDNRRNFEFSFDPKEIRLSQDVSFKTSLLMTQEQQRESGTDGLNFFNRYEASSRLNFGQFKPAKWVTVIPGSVNYLQTLYSTDDQESRVELRPQVKLNPSRWNSIDVSFLRTFFGDNTRPFQDNPVRGAETHELRADVRFFTPKGRLPNVPPGYIAFQDDLPGDLPIPLTFPDDTQEDLDLIASQNQEQLEADVSSSFNFDLTNIGFNYTSNRWNRINANFGWTTTPNLYRVQLNTAYDPNEGEIDPINLTFTGKTSTTFVRGRRSGLDQYEPGLDYRLQATYDPENGELSSYNVGLDATLGTTWQNHWRLRLDLNQEGIRNIEVRRDLRDFEVRLTYDPRSELLRLEGILVAFPSRPAGITQESGSFSLSTPIDSVNSRGLLD